MSRGSLRIRPASRRHRGEPGHRVNEAGLAIRRYRYSWLTDHPLAWDAAVDAVARLNADISEDAVWTVFEVRGMNDTGQVIGLETAVIVGIYHQLGHPPRSQLGRQQVAGSTMHEGPIGSSALASPGPGAVCRPRRTD